MNVSVLQPYYSMEPNDMEKCFDSMMSEIKKCDSSMDIIVLPEYCDVPSNTKDCEQFHLAIEKYNEVIKKRSK